MATAPIVWTCPNCEREFGSKGQGHMCSPGLTVEEFLDGSPPFVEPVFRRVDEVVRAVDAASPEGALIIDPLENKVLYKNGPTFCILDVKKQWVAVGFSLRRSLHPGRMSRKIVDYSGKFHHVVNVVDPDVIDDEFAEWLAEAYHHGTEAKVSSASGSDPMIPDDIDFEIAPPC